MYSHEINVFVRTNQTMLEGNKVDISMESFREGV